MAVSKRLSSASYVHEEPYTSPGPGTQEERKVVGGAFLSHRHGSLVLNSHWTLLFTWLAHRGNALTHHWIPRGSTQAGPLKSDWRCSIWKLSRVYQKASHSDR